MKTLISLFALACLSAASAKEVDIAGGITATTSGTTTRGLRGVTFIFSSDFTGTVAGMTFNGATDTSYSPPVQTGDTLSAIAYVVTTGNIRIMPVR
jgi:hypothetical protein